MTDPGDDLALIDIEALIMYVADQEIEFDEDALLDLLAMLPATKED